MDYQSRSVKHDPAQPGSNRVGLIIGGLLTFALLAGAVFSTASVAQLSYQAAQYQKEEAVLRQRQQYLEEQLALAQALALPLAYAQDNGFVDAPSHTIATLDLTPDLAGMIPSAAR